MERIKKISWTLLILSILIALISYGAQFVNFNNHKESIINHIEKEGQFTAKIDGDIVIQVLPLAVSIKDFNIYDLNKNLVLSAKKINLNINPFAIFSGLHNAIDVKNILISEGVIDVRNLKSHVKTKDLVLRSLILERCKLTSDTMQSLLIFDDINATIKYGSSVASDDLEVISDLLIAGQRFNFNANFVNIDESGNAESSSFSLSNNAITTKFTGVLKDLFTSPELKGDVTTEISSPENFNHFIENNKFLEQFFRNNQMNFSSSLLVKSNKIIIDNISINSRDIKNVSGNFVIDLNSGLDISSEITIDQIDVDGIYSTPEKPRDKVTLKELESYLVKFINDFDFYVPDDVSEMLTLNVKTIKLNEQLINNVLVSADVFDGGMLINEISCQLPYSGNIKIDGKVARNEVRANLNSSVFLDLPEFDNIAKWLSIEDEILLSIKRFVTKFDIDLIPHHVSLNDIKASLGDIQFVGKASAYDDGDGKLSLDSSCRFKKLDLDFFQIDKLYDETLFNLFKSDFDKTGTKFSELTKDLRWLRTWKTPLKLEITADELIFNKESFSNAYASIDLFQNNLLVRQFTLKDDGVSMKSDFELTVPVFRPYLKGNIEFAYLDTKKMANIFPDFSKYKKRYKDYIASYFAESQPKDLAEQQFRETQVETSNYDINFLGASSYDADIKVNIQSIKSEDNYLKSLSFDASLLNGVAKINKISSDLLYGSLQANLVVSILTAVPYFNASFTVMNANPNMLFKYVSGVDKGLDGYLNASGTLYTKGAALNSIYNSLNGQISAVSKRLIYNGVDFGKVIDSVQSSLEVTEKMKSVRYYMSYGKSMFNTVRSSIKIINGTAETTDVVFESDRVSGALAARCVLSSKMCAVSSRFAFIPVGYSTPLFISMQSRGNISQLQTEVDYESIQKYILNMVRSSNGDSSTNNTVESILKTRRGGA